MNNTSTISALSSLEFFCKNHNPKDLRIEDMELSKNYVVETLINGNKKECINHIRLLICLGIGGMQLATEALIKIKEQCPESFDYIIKQVYSF